MTAKKYRKKPRVVEALLIEPDMRWQTIIDFCGGEGGAASIIYPGLRPGESEAHSYVEIETLEGTMRADGGDYIIKGVAGEFYPCKPDIFEQTYEPVE